MKSLNKKISVVVLTGLALTGPGLSQEFVAHAAPRLLSQYLLKDPNNTLDTEATFNFITVKINQNRHRYDALYLGEHNDFYSKFIEKYQSVRNRKYGFLYPKRGHKNSIIF